MLFSREYNITDYKAPRRFGAIKSWDSFQLASFQQKLSEKWNLLQIKSVAMLFFPEVNYLLLLCTHTSIHTQVA
jgi:hypothetical protein